MQPSSASQSTRVARAFVPDSVVELLGGPAEARPPIRRSSSTIIRGTYHLLSQQPEPSTLVCLATCIMPVAAGNLLQQHGMCYYNMRLL
jgi:hypothetical protein